MRESMYYYFTGAVEWLNPAVYLAGLWIAVWTFLRCRKCGYLVMAAYFALVIFWLVVWPPIDRGFRAHHSQNDSAQARQKIDAAVHDAIHKVLAEEGHPEGVAARRSVHFPFGPILLVVGLWLVAKSEVDRRDTAPLR